MADRTLAHRAQNVTVTEKLNLPPTAAPTNHGKTVAAWFTTYAVIIAFTVAGLGVAFALTWLFWVGHRSHRREPDRRPAARRRPATARAAPRLVPARRATAATEPPPRAS